MSSRGWAAGIREAAVRGCSIGAREARSTSIRRRQRRVLFFRRLALQFPTGLSELLGLSGEDPLEAGSGGQQCRVFQEQPSRPGGGLVRRHCEWHSGCFDAVRDGSGYVVFQDQFDDARRTGDERWAEVLGRGTHRSGQHRLPHVGQPPLRASRSWLVVQGRPRQRRPAWSEMDGAAGRGGRARRRPMAS